MYNRRILYGYLIQNGELTVKADEAATVKRVFNDYLEGLSYQAIAEMLNEEKIPYSPEVAEWNKHKVKRLLENPRYAGEKEYPAIIEGETFANVQQLIQSKATNYTPKKAKQNMEVDANINNEETGLTAYAPSAEVVKIDNSINRALEKAEQPEVILDLILQGIAARYECCG